jgi:hypothetical protein
MEMSATASLPRADISAADVVAFLQTLSPSSLEQPQYKELYDEGIRLFGRVVRKSIFQDEGMANFWKEYKQTLKKLEKVLGIM